MRTNSRAPLQFVTSPLIAANYPAVAIRSDGDELYTIMPFVEQLLPNMAIIVCQRTEKPSVQYVNANCKKVLGYTVTEIKRMTLPDFLTLVHTDDIQDVQQCFAFINKLEPYDPLQYRFTLHYRIRHKQGHYIHITDEKMAMTNRRGEYMYINAIQDVTDAARFHDVHLEVNQYMGNEYRKIQTYIPRGGQSEFTPRQKDIVNLIEKGFSNQEIARRLAVSVNTIKNHKSLLFRKVRVKNTVELLQAARHLKDQ